MCNREIEIKESTSEDLQVMLKRLSDCRQKELERVCADLVEQYVTKARSGRLSGTGGVLGAVVSCPRRYAADVYDMRTILIKKGWSLATQEEVFGIFSFWSFFCCRYRMCPCEPCPDGFRRRRMAF